MTDNEIIKALEEHIERTKNIKYGARKMTTVDVELLKNALDLINRRKAEIERLTAFKSYFDELYGKGLDIANWHKNGDLEPFDSFYNSALEEMVGDAK